LILDSHEEIGFHVAIRARMFAEIIMPFAWDRFFDFNSDDCPAKGYHSAPDDILYGNFDGVDWEYALDLFRAGRIPRCALGAVYETGAKLRFNSESTNWSRQEWFKYNSLSKNVSRHGDLVTWAMILDESTDWFKYYPPHSTQLAASQREYAEFLLSLSGSKG
jgi:hypothetical protein